MKLAHQIKKQEGVKMSAAMKKAWAIMKNKGDNKMSILDMIKKESAKINKFEAINSVSAESYLEYFQDDAEGKDEIMEISLVENAKRLLTKGFEQLKDSAPFTYNVFFNYDKKLQSFRKKIDPNNIITTGGYKGKLEKANDQDKLELRNIVIDLLFIKSIFTQVNVDLSNEKFTGLESYSNKADDDNLVQNFWSTHKAAKAGSADAIKSRKALAQEIVSKNIDMGDFNNFVIKTAKG